MKKLVIVALALFLALPALSYAGSATSRWDMTIGGYIAFDYGYANNAVGADYKAGTRETISNGALTKQNLDSEFNNQFAQTGETRLNFLMLGPDAWGAKTRGFIEYDFKGSSTGGSYINGAASLRHAYIRMDWANDQLLMGEFWTGWLGGTPPLGLIGWNLPAFGKSNRVPQVRWTHMFSPQVKGIVGFEYPGRQYNQNADYPNTNGSDYVDNYTRANIPNLFAVAEWASDACGKIGPQKLLFGVGGFYGQEKIPTDSTTDKVASAAATRRYNSDTESAWTAIVYTYIPIIPEKNNNKTGAIGFTAGFGAGQNGGYENPNTISAYQRPGNNFSSPLGVAWYAGGFIYLSDAFRIAPTFSTQWINASNYYRTQVAGTSNYALPPVGGLVGLPGVTFIPGNADTIVREDMYNLAFLYDVNPALTLGLELTNLYARYAGPGYINNYMLSPTSNLKAARIRATYFF